MWRSSCGKARAPSTRAWMRWASPTASPSRPGSATFCVRSSSPMSSRPRGPASPWSGKSFSWSSCWGGRTASATRSRIISSSSTLALSSATASPSRSSCSQSTSWSCNLWTLMPGAGASPPLEIDILRKIYRNADGRSVEAVRNLAFSIQPHSFVCLIGPSGCGKTTILRILLGLDRDFEGCVRPDVGDLPVGVVFQEPRLLPWRTVEENVGLSLRSYRLARTLDPLFAELDLEDWRHRYPGELSLGMARRAALARALAIEPDLLVLDEPFVSL